MTINRLQLIASRRRHEAPSTSQNMSKKRVLIYSAESSVPTSDICKGDALMDLESGAKIVNIDNNLVDPQLCSTMTYDIYNHLRASKANKRPSTYFMAKVQKDVNPGMRAILIN
ncbi:hypothetical protein H5410_041655 [Solanum commersonii]|uniref:Uncharacterized protein n=1 Tax=Solanum commersonii TaxID=4109 RepID=A0A9J5XTH8_SOLCO|nr:hypothetical protein H5410_041655 [Solanum commersonii]